MTATGAQRVTNALLNYQSTEGLAVAASFFPDSNPGVRNDVPGVLLESALLAVDAAGLAALRAGSRGLTSTATTSTGAANRILTNADFPVVNAKLSTQRQARHIEGAIDPRTSQPVNGSVMKSQADAQEVLDAYRSGQTTVVGRTQQGFPVVRHDGVQGRYVSELNTGRVINEPSNVFIIKGSRSPSIVPANPQTYK